MPLIFSYGTLQQDDVQRSTFGRRLQRQKDALPGFEPSQVQIEDPQLVAGGKTHHDNVTFNGRQDRCVSGTVLEITEAELAAADTYEWSAQCKRITQRPTTALLRVASLRTHPVDRQQRTRQHGDP